jgi:hypothetical protein
MICGAPISRCARGRRGRGAAHLERARVDAEAVVLERVADVLGALAARERDADVRLPADRDRARDCARRVPEDEVHAVAANTIVPSAATTRCTARSLRRPGQRDDGGGGGVRKVRTSSRCAAPPW